MDEIMKKYANDVKRFCFSLCHNEDLAEELTQETFFKAVKTIRNYNGNCSMITWLFQIAKRTWIDYLRKKKITIPLDNVLESKLIEKETPESLFYKKIKQEFLYQIIEELEEPGHSVFLMRSLLDKNFREIGKEFNKSENWARITYYRVRIKLAERIKDYENSL